MRPRLCFSALMWALAVPLLVGGCHLGRRPPFQPPSAVIYVDHFPGEPLSGVTAAAVTITDPEDALDIRVEVSALERMPTGVGRPLGESARLLVATCGLEPVRPSAKLTGDVRLIDLAPEGNWPLQGEFGRIAPLRHAVGALPEGATLRLVVVTDDDQWEFMICRPLGRATSIQIAVIRQTDYRPPAEPADEPDPGAQPAPPVAAVQEPPVRVREVALLERPCVTTADRVCILVPVPSTDSPAQGLAVVFDIRPGSTEAEYLHAVAQARDDLKRAAQQSADRPDRLAIGSSTTASLQTALQSLTDGSDSRAALVFLAGQTGARLCEATAMVADEVLLARLAELVSSRGAMLGLNPDELGWQMDRTTFELHAELLSGGKLPAELAAVLISYAGEAGRNPASVDEVSKALAARADFEARLVAENLIFLEDSSPAARVRAFDWLAARGRAPAGYDPLGTLRERREALEKALQAAPTTAPAGGQS